MRVLIVDNSYIAREAIREVLELNGHTVVADAVDGPSALTAVRELEIDVVLLDVLLSNETGYEVAKALTDADSTLPVVIMSMDSTDEALARASGARAAIAKESLATVDLASLIA